MGLAKYWVKNFGLGSQEMKQEIHKDVRSRGGDAARSPTTSQGRRVREDLKNVRKQERKGALD